MEELNVSVVCVDNCSVLLVILNKYNAKLTAYLPHRQKYTVSFQRSSRQFIEGPPGPQKKTRSIGSTVDQVWWLVPAGFVCIAAGRIAHLFPGPTN